MIRSMLLCCTICALMLMGGQGARGQNIDVQSMTSRERENGTCSGSSDPSSVLMVSGAQWIQQQSPDSRFRPDLSIVNFFDSETGIVAGSGAYRTTDGGNSWDKVSSHSFADVSFVDAWNGWAVDDYATLDRKIYHTTDGGLSWPLLSTLDGIGDLASIHFLNSRQGWAVGFPGNILQTTDGGRTWIKHELGGYDSGGFDRFEAVYFINPNIGWIVGTEGSLSSVGVLLHTSDGGQSWNRRTAEMPLFKDITFVDSTTGYLVGWTTTNRGLGSAVHGTMDAGRSWTAKAFLESTLLFSVSFMDERNGFAVGSGGSIVHTTDGGLSWTQEGGITRTNLLAVQYINSQTAIAVGEGGVVVRTNDAGISLIEAHPWNDDVSVDALSLLASPNLATPTTTFRFSHPTPNHAPLTHHHATGRAVAVIVSEGLPAGEHQYVWDAARIPSGVYFYRLEAGGSIESRKMVLVR